MARTPIGARHVAVGQGDRALGQPAGRRGRPGPQPHPRAVQRTVPFGLLCVSLVVCWYAQHGQPAADLAAHRARAPWYRTKHTVSLADMLNALRRELLAAEFLSSHLVTPTLEELLHAQAAGAADAA
jgi:hypothetical protein